MAKAKSKALADRRVPSQRETEAIAAATSAQLARPIRAAMDVEVKADGGVNVSTQHSDDTGGAILVKETFGTSSAGFALAAMTQLINSTAPASGADTRTTNAGLALVGAIAPQHELETALALQMVATPELAMTTLARAKTTSRVNHMKEYGNLATKLTRTFATQMKTLADWRRGGEQVVRHVHVNEGGQAIVAETVNVGGQQNAKSIDQCHALNPALLCHDAEANGVPIAGSEG